jgi:hypothetical protein
LHGTIVGGVLDEEQRSNTPILIVTAAEGKAHKSC